VTVDFEQIERFFITNSSSSNNHDDDDDRDKKLDIKKKTILFDLIASLNSTEKGTTHITTATNYQKFHVLLIPK
jgi:hypothetical protein